VLESRVQPPQVQVLVLVLPQLLLHLVGVHSVQEVLPTLAVLHVLDTHADPLGQDLATNALVDDDADGALGDVEHTPSLAVVSLVGHTLLEGTATLNINNVSDLVHLKVGGEVFHPGLLEAPREHVSRSATVSSWVSHSDFS